MTTKQTEKITGLFINVATGEVIERELTAEELAQREIDSTEIQARQTAAEAKATARASALAKLAELGLTQEEIAAL
jgi:DNA-binding NarL/FixJ family response regulator